MWLVGFRTKTLVQFLSVEMTGNDEPILCYGWIAILAVGGLSVLIDDKTTDNVGTVTSFKKTL